MWTVNLLCKLCNRWIDLSIIGSIDPVTGLSLSSKRSVFMAETNGRTPTRYCYYLSVLNMSTSYDWLGDEEE